MYRLEKLTIHGFKSFYDRTEIVLPARTTAVVGPNGCGKSNISDAIHWVLGEQRVRTLRGEKMEDVIFNGSQRRKPLGMAEVSLFLARDGNPDEPDEVERAGDLALSDDLGPLEELPEVPRGEDEAAPLAVTEGSSGTPATPGNDQGSGAGTAPGNGGGPPLSTESAGGDGTGGPQAASGNGHARELKRPAALIPGHWPEKIRITRRLFRDGQSEYLIDGARCRLRDLRDLLHRLSIGSSAAIIEQGKVEQIVASKPRDRRVLIEEAAGIAGFKAKRREALLKLEATEANLLRLDDIVGEVRRQINSVKRQAGKARRYGRLMEERRRLERIAYHHQTQELDGKLQEMRGRRAGVQDEETALAARLAEAQADAERVRAEVEEGDRRLTAARDGLHALDLQVDREERGVHQARKEAAELQAGATAAEREAEELGVRAGEADAEVVAREAEGIELGAEVRRLWTEANAVDADVAARGQAIESAEEALEARRRRLFDLLDRASDLRGRLQRLEEDRRRALGAAERGEREAKETAAERDLLATELAELDRTVGACDERAGSLERAVADWGRRASDYRQRLSGAETRREEARLERGSLQERLESLEARDREDSPQGRAARAASASARGVVADFVRPQQELEEAAENFLTDLLPAVLLDVRESVGPAVGRLREASAGRGSFLVPGLPRPLSPALPPELAADARVRGRLADLLGAQGTPGEAVRAAADGAVVVQDLEAALELAGRYPERSFLALTGEVVRPGGLVTAGRGADSAGGILALRRRIDETRRSLERAGVATDKAVGDVEELRREILADEKRIEEAAAERSKLLVSAAEMRERRGSLSEGHERAARAHQVRVDEAARERADHARWGEEAAALGAELQGVDSDQAALEAAIRSATADLERGREELAARVEEAADLGRRNEGARTRLEAAGAEIVRLRDAAAELRERADRNLGEVTARRRRAADLEELAARTEVSLHANLERRGQEKAKLQEESEELEQLRGRAAERMEEAKRHATVLEKVRARRTELDVGISRAESERGFLERSCRNDLDQSLAEAAEAMAEGEADTSASEVTAALAEVRDRIERLGPVNVMAVEEFQELEGRYGFLTGQQKDLQGSVRSLRDTIARINRRSRERFQSAFEQIRLNFQEGYRVLFGGGRADLHLEEDESDILESGVEISAQPPGKRLQRIALLSGGEKALTAISLLFAIFRYRPSPFCILDEVDAPLDEANVGRYAEMLRHMAQDTQFVVITHNKRTMEHADVLYGVTMQEPGVSRLVSVRFESDGRLAARDGSGEFMVESPVETPAPTPA